MAAKGFATARDTMTLALRQCWVLSPGTSQQCDEPVATGADGRSMPLLLQWCGPRSDNGDVTGDATVAPMTAPLLTTKLYITPARPSSLLRQRLVEQLNQGLRSGRILTLVSAPAGFAKTTLVGAWVQTLGRATKHRAEPELLGHIAVIRARIVLAERDLPQAVELAPQALDYVPPRSLLHGHIAVIQGQVALYRSRTKANVTARGAETPSPCISHPTSITVKLAAEADKTALAIYRA